ncbi:MAG TPA: YceI family protein [Pseudonocardiaceae bacterium]|nr:YceI family protein [Pseudonocardiaceae bacterium]
MSTPTVNIPGYLTGTWDIDPIHSDVSITARHLLVSKVRGHFEDFGGTITTAENPLDSKVDATIQATSINTKQGQRDDHIRSADFLDVENFPTITFVSTGLRTAGDDYELDGNLTLHGVTKPVTLKLEITGFGPGMGGEQRVGFEAKTSVNRKEFDIRFNGTIEGTGGAVVSDKLDVTLAIEAILRAA